jgi:hypothetical protein
VGDAGRRRAGQAAEAAEAAGGKVRQVTVLDPLVAFVLARIEEEERDARLGCEAVHPPYGGYHPEGHEDPKVATRCAALRALVAPHAPVPLAAGSTWLECARCIDARDARDAREDWPCDVVRGVAAIWAWHDDFQNRWAAEP